ncbi:MAG: hypothetical protein AAF533_00765 [Acidobacteriota bacterium]
MASAAILIAPLEPVPEEVDDSPAEGQPDTVSLSELIHHRGISDPIASAELRPGVLHGHRGRHAALDWYDWSVDDPELDTEPSELIEILKAHGGEALLLWTYGHAAHVWHFRARGPDRSPEHVIASVRLRAPNGRADHGLAALRRSLQGSVFEPDWSTIDTQVAAPSLSVTAWFEAFGAPGAQELVPDDLELAWETMARVVETLLRGDPASPEDVAYLNGLLALDHEDHLLPLERGSRSSAELANALHDAAGALSTVYGPTTIDRWLQPEDVAASALDIWDDPCPAWERLTGGWSALAASAAIGRFIGNYPSSMLRDPFFHLEAGGCLIDCFSHNRAFFELAVTIGTAGFTISIHSADDDAGFQAAMGMAGRTTAVDGLTAQVFLDLPSAPAKEARAALAAWYSKAKATGLVVRAESTGDWTITRHVEGEVATHDLSIDEDALRSAARDFEPRRAVLALGLPDLLDPGERSNRQGRQRRMAEARERTLAAVNADGAVTHALTGPAVLSGALKTSLDHAETNTSVALWLDPGPVDASTFDELHEDLGLGHAWAWTEGSSLLVSIRRNDVEHLVRALADLPGPVRLVVATDEQHISYSW